MERVKGGGRFIGFGPRVPKVGWISGMGVIGACGEG